MKQKLNHNRAICSGDTGRESNKPGGFDSTEAVHARIKDWSTGFLKGVAASNKNKVWRMVASSILRERSKAGSL